MRHSDPSGLIFAKTEVHHAILANASSKGAVFLKHATDRGPQDITLHGRSVAVVVSREPFDRLIGNPDSLVDTHVLSNLRRKQPQPDVVPWIAQRPR